MWYVLVTDDRDGSEVGRVKLSTAIAGYKANILFLHQLENARIDAVTVQGSYTPRYAMRIVFEGYGETKYFDQFFGTMRKNMRY